MKHGLFFTTMLAVIGMPACYIAFAAPPEPAPKVYGSAGTSIHSVRDPKIAAERFVEHINYARVALAMKNPQYAEAHIAQARDMMKIVRNGGPAPLTLANIGSGRLVYEYDTDYKYHYFPIETGPIEIKKMGKGPFWAKKGLAVTDAEIVYLTLDLTGDKPGKYLSEAEEAIKAGKLDEADSQLAELTESVVSVNEEEGVPLDKARDNITLARDFIATRNYDGARYALRHADDALDDAERDERYSDLRPGIRTMRREVTHLEHMIAKNDPSLLDKADAKMARWWRELKQWAATEKQDYAPAR